MNIENYLNETLKEHKLHFTLIDPDEQTPQEALKIAEIIFNNAIESTVSKVKAKEKVDIAIENSKDGIMVLEKFFPWKEFLLESNNSKAKLINFALASCCGAWAWARRRVL